MSRIRKSGPAGVIRPYQPAIDFQGTMSEGEKIADALEHIATALSAIDHNLEVLVNHFLRTQR
jgi:hypothetical protein